MDSSGLRHSQLLFSRLFVRLGHPIHGVVRLRRLQLACGLWSQRLWQSLQCQHIRIQVCRHWSSFLQTFRDLPILGVYWRIQQTSDKLHLLLCIWSLYLYIQKEGNLCSGLGLGGWTCQLIILRAMEVRIRIRQPRSKY